MLAAMDVALLWGQRKGPSERSQVAKTAFESQLSIY